MSAEAPDGAVGPSRLAVAPELVREQLVVPLHARAMELMRSRGPDRLDEGWEEARAELAPEVGRNEKADHFARALAQAGYAAREAELERFEPARAGTGWLGDEVVRRIDEGLEQPAARRNACVELALTEPEERAAPDSGAASWRVPGPGAHIRHLLALEAAAELAPDPKRPPTGLDRRRDVKRCWLYGFLLRSCEEERDG